jgi:4-hydroxymandelate oxidase
VAGRVEVYVDGGVRRSPDVVKALALGARSAWVGRPSLWAVATGGSKGVEALLRWYETELRRAMALCGTGSVDEIDRRLVRRTPGWTGPGPALV